MYRVRWKKSALDELTRTWTQADSSMRVAITAATHAIDQQLQSNPYEGSESREHGVRVLFVFPLGIRFEIDEQHSVVQVYHIWSFRKRR